MMRRLLPALALALLVACTGTSSPQPPRLLFVTHGAGPYLAALIEDDLQTQPRFTYLSDSETTLPGEPLALDVTDRAGARDQVVLLLETAAHAYSAAWFDVAGLDPDTVTELTPTVLALEPLLVPELDDPNDLCLTDLQVSGDGELLALLNAPQKCGGSLAAPSIFVLDTADSSVTSLVATNQLLESGLHISQADNGDEEVLYWLVGGVSKAMIEGYRLPDGPPLVGSVGEFMTGSDLPVPLQFTFTAGNFAALQPSRLHLFDETASSLVQSPASASEVVKDPFGDELQAVLVLHESSSTCNGKSNFSQSCLFVHSSTDDSTPSEVQLTARTLHGSLDPLQMWAYFTRAGGLVVVDLIEVLDEAADSPTGPATPSANSASQA